MDKSRWLTPGFAAVVALTALALVVMNHLPGRAPAPRVAPIEPTEAVVALPSGQAPEPPPPADKAAGEAQLAAAIAPAPAPPVPQGPRTIDDPRLAPLRRRAPKAKKPRPRLDARSPEQTVAPAVAQAQAQQHLQAATNPAIPAERAAVARQALAFVGADPEAESVWLDAINDPERSAHERSDLIEDLNEEGFADPHNPTIEDLPLIENRLALIEALAEDAMDDTNAAAFAEAYKDLANMYARVVEQHAANNAPVPPDFAAEGPIP
jgi:hypothetical protein